MPVRFRCSECQSLLGIASRKAGESVRCPRCGAVLAVPGGVPRDPPPKAINFGPGAEEARTEYDWRAVLPSAEPAAPVISAPGLGLPGGPDRRGEERHDDAVNSVSRAGPARPAVNGPEAFVWWQGRFHGRTFPFKCPGCGTTAELRQRVTLTRRTCPGCGYRIDIAAVDRQLEAMEPERRRLMAGCGCGQLRSWLLSRAWARRGWSFELAAGQAEPGAAPDRRPPVIGWLHGPGRHSGGG